MFFARILAVAHGNHVCSMEHLAGVLVLFQNLQDFAADLLRDRNYPVRERFPTVRGPY